MPALVAGIHVFLRFKNVDGRDKPGHDEQNPRSLSGSVPVSALWAARQVERIGQNWRVQGKPVNWSIVFVV